MAYLHLLRLTILRSGKAAHALPATTLDITEAFERLLAPLIPVGGRTQFRSS